MLAAPVACNMFTAKRSCRPCEDAGAVHRAETGCFWSTCLLHQRTYTQCASLVVLLLACVGAEPNPAATCCCCCLTHAPCCQLSRQQLTASGYKPLAILQTECLRLAQAHKVLHWLPLVLFGSAPAALWSPRRGDPPLPPHACLPFSAS